MEFRQLPMGFMEFYLQNNYHQAVNKMKFNFANCLMIVAL